MTNIYADQFESGDFSAWDGVVFTAYAGEVHEVSSAEKHHGIYSQHSKIKFIASRAICYEADSISVQELYARLYFNFVTLPASANYVDILCVVDTSGDLVSLRIFNDAGSMKLQVRYSNGWTWTNTNSGALTINAATWYCLEMRLRRAATGDLEVWFDGNKEIDVTPDLTLRYDAWERIEVGLQRLGADQSYVEAYTDCVVAADAPIGVEGAAPTEIAVDGAVSAIGTLLRDKELTISGATGGIGGLLSGKNFTISGLAATLGTILRDKTFTVEGIIDALGVASVEEFLGTLINVSGNILSQGAIEILMSGAPLRAKRGRKVVQIEKPFSIILLISGTPVEQVFHGFGVVGAIFEESKVSLQLHGVPYENFVLEAKVARRKRFNDVIELIFGDD